MIGIWRTPEGEVIKMDDSVREHIDYAYDSGWLDDFLINDPRPDDDADPQVYYDWVQRAKNYLFEKNFIRSRYSTGRNAEDISIQGKPSNINRRVIAQFLEAYGKDKDFPLTIEDGEHRELLRNGTILDWALKTLDKPSDALCKDVVAPSHLIVQRRFI